MALLKAEHITKTYNQCTILKDINIELHQKDEIMIHEQKPRPDDFYLTETFLNYKRDIISRL